MAGWVKGVNFINHFQFLYKIMYSKLWCRCLCITVPCKSYFMFGFYIIIHYSYMTDELSMQRRGVATWSVIRSGGYSCIMLTKQRGGGCNLDKPIALFEKNPPISTLQCLGPYRKQSYSYRITALYTCPGQLRSGSMNKTTWRSPSTACGSYLMENIRVNIVNVLETNERTLGS